MAKKIDLEIDLGADFSFSFVAKDFNGNVINLTNFTAHGNYSTSHTNLSDVTPFTSVVITNAVGGGITVTINNTDSGLLDPDSRYVYNVWVVSATNNITYVVEGIMFVSGKV
jgi:hypothetical protein